jgi:hypothetical protein
MQTWGRTLSSRQKHTNLARNIDTIKISLHLPIQLSLAPRLMCLSAAKKTNILFHLTPSVSYESMYVQLEKRTYILYGRVLLSIVVLGKLFGGTLHGLVPLGLCVSSDIFLWMRELVTKGKSHE